MDLVTSSSSVSTLATRSSDLSLAPIVLASSPCTSRSSCTLALRAASVLAKLNSNSSLVFVNSCFCLRSSTSLPSTSLLAATSASTLALSCSTFPTSSCLLSSSPLLASCPSSRCSCSLATCPLAAPSSPLTRRSDWSVARSSASTPASPSFCTAARLPLVSSALFSLYPDTD